MSHDDQEGRGTIKSKRAKEWKTRTAEYLKRNVQSVERTLLKKNFTAWRDGLVKFAHTF